MTALAQAAAAYAGNKSQIRTPRSTEYDVMSRVTRNLNSTKQDRDTHFPAFVQAVHANRQLWTHLAATVAENENALDPELRAKLFYLAEFTIEHSRKVLAESASVDVLLDINTSVMRGLVSAGA